MEDLQPAKRRMTPAHAPAAAAANHWERGADAAAAASENLQASQEVVAY